MLSILPGSFERKIIGEVYAFNYEFIKRVQESAMDTALFAARKLVAHADAVAGRH